MELTTVEIFDPPMCCSSGLCGPDVDPALLQIQDALLRIAAKWPDTVRVERYSPSQQPGKFAENADVMRLLESHGASVLPVTAINSEIKQYGEYPTYDDLEKVITQLREGDANASK